MTDTAADILAGLRPLGSDLTPELVQGTYRVVTPHAARLDPAICEASWDHAYGPHPRQRLDVFRPKGTAPRTVVIYVHGGGFSAGDKGGEGKPFFANVGAWATRLGMGAVAMTYRLAPEAQWPDGGRDVAAAVAYLAENSAALFGAAPRVVLVGQSAGATHVADCLTGRGGPRHPAIAGAVLMSGIFDYVRLESRAMADAYFGTDPARFAEHSTLPLLAALDLPLMFTLAELEARTFHDQAMAVVEAFMARTGRWPAMHYLPGHNHISPAPLIGSVADDSGPLIERFIAGLAG